MEKKEEYNKVLEEQIQGLKGTVEDQNEQEHNKKRTGTFWGRTLDYAVDKTFSGEGDNLVRKSVKTTIVTGGAFIGGCALGFLPLVSGGSVALLALVGYGGKKFVYDPIKKRRSSE
ncbi:MAG: hypothetical protein ISS23_01335 [Nanoarchaeota archaeon]|nr:hypothetical protein [Nanoarchaeota archaeon]